MKNLLLIAVSDRSCASKCGNFDNLASEANMGKPETPANQPAVGEQLTHLFGTRIRRNVKILGSMTQQQVTHPATNQKGLVPGILEPIKNLQSTLGDIDPRYRMAGSWHDQWCQWVRCPYRCQKLSSAGNDTAPYHNSLKSHGSINTSPATAD